MTEEIWLALETPWEFFRTLCRHPDLPVFRRFTDWRLRLFAIACAGRVLHSCDDPRIGAALRIAERFVEDPTYRHQEERVTDCDENLAAELAWLTSAEGRLARALVENDPVEAAFNSSICAAFVVDEGWEDDEEEQERQVPLLRDIVGNPFRPVPFERRWRTPTVEAIARGIYDDRAFDRLPILADALMDAGCFHEEILAHCRSEGPHVRGCWVVDAVLGKG